MAEEESRRGKTWLLSWLSPILCGLLLSLAYPPFDQGWLVWIVPGLLLLMIWHGAPEKKSGRWAFRVSWLAGIAFFLVNLKWLWTVTGAGAVALAVFFGFGWGFWGWFVVKLANPLRTKFGSSGAIERGARSLCVGLLAAFAWVGVEWFRSKGILAFSWNGLGAAFIETPVIAQAADLVGVTALSFLPVFISAVLAQTVMHMRQELRAGKLRAHLDFCTAMLVLVLVVIYGIVRLQQFSPAAAKREIGVVMVQQNIPQSVQWDTMTHTEIYDGFADLTEEAVKTVFDSTIESSGLGEKEEGAFSLPQIDMVVWPEVAIGEPLLFLADGRKSLAVQNDNYLRQRVFPLGNFTLMTGMAEVEMEIGQGDRWYPVEKGDTYNSIVSFGPEGSIGEVYRKSHLVVYGEYIPFVEDVPLLADIYKMGAGVEYGGDISAGTSRDPLQVSLGEDTVSVIPSICFEDTDALLSREFVRDESQVIVNVTNDGWFFGSEGALQHSANARFRCIELRRPMIRCANAGVTALVAPTGAILRNPQGQKMELTERGWIYGNVPIYEGSWSLYSMWGDWFSYISLIVCGGVLVRRLVKSRTRKE